MRFTQIFAAVGFVAIAFSSPDGLRGIALPVNQPSVIRHEQTTIHALNQAVNASAAQTLHISKHDSQGRVQSLVGAFTIQDDSAGTPGCNAALDLKRRVYYKTAIRVSTFVPGSCADNCAAGATCCRDPTSAADKGACFGVKSCSDLQTGAGLGGGDLLTIDIETGAVLRNQSMTGTPHHPPSLAYSATTGLAYGVVPYSYTEYGVFSYDTSSGAVTQLNTLKKGTMDGIGNCIGGVIDLAHTSILWYQLSQGHEHVLVFLDLHTLKEVQRIPGFYMTVKDPNGPRSLLGLMNTEPGVALLRLSPFSNKTTILFSMSNTTLGDDLRAQDQASFAVDDSGKNVWFAASYNVKSGDLYRGVFALELDGDTATLKSQSKFFGQPDQKTIVIGRLDWV